MRSETKRDPYFDNARFILIFLVVIGHMISPYRDHSQLLDTAYKFIYTFHMPGFILIAGYFAKNVFRKGYTQKLMKKLLLPYFIFQTIFSGFFLVIEGDQRFTLFDPEWTLWFLLSMLGWHLLLIVFARIPYSLTLALLIGLVIGMVPMIGTYLSLSRTFVFFPVFLLGYKLKKEHFDILRNPIYQKAAIVFLIGLFFSYHTILSDLTTDWLLASSSYADIGVEETYGIWMRLFIYGAVFLATFSVLSLIPNRSFPFTYLGGRTLYIYLLHGLVVKTLDLTPIFEKITASGQLWLFLVLSIAVTLLLGSRPVTKSVKPLIEPYKVFSN
ncbi:acyltransferase family protein [Virgibacillus sp. MSP4-1]|uniref:acyltransferase family protein n=1 Tax=Virgibacillus sp. MSP4-1 TaxID=2700081 RepID=UPI00039A2444|nr:acyltransferase family protein [Virgibacillus sp. MSP4-1]QHS23180.1 acyltransferase family protein [Virgibacillus sp. MSP4-1]